MAAGGFSVRGRPRGGHIEGAALLLLAARRPCSERASRQQRAHSAGTGGPGGSAYVGGSSQGGGSQGGGSQDDASSESGCRDASDDASSESSGGEGMGPWRKPPPPYSPAGGGASVEASVGDRLFSRVLHKCARCRKEFDGSDHGVGGGARSRSAAASASGGGRSGFVHWGQTRFCTAVCAQSAAAEQGGLSPEEVTVTAVPRSRRRRASSAAPPGQAAAGAPSEEEREAALKMDEHKAAYASVRRALAKTREAAHKRGGSFAAMVRLPPPPSGSGLMLAASASVGVDHAGNPDLFGAALAALMVAAAPSLRGRMQATMSTLRSEAAARERSKSLLAGVRAGDEFVSALTLEAQAALRSSLDRAARARQLAAAAPVPPGGVPREVFSGGFKKSAPRLHAEVASALRDAKNVRAELASFMVVR